MPYSMRYKVGFVYTTEGVRDVVIHVDAFDHPGQRYLDWGSYGLRRILGSPEPTFRPATTVPNIQVTFPPSMFPRAVIRHIVPNTQWSIETYVDCQLTR